MSSFNFLRKIITAQKQKEPTKAKLKHSIGEFNIKKYFLFSYTREL